MTPGVRAPSRSLADVRAGRWIERLTALLIVLAVLGPLLWDRGFVLIGDMVFVPDQPWKPAWIGADGGVPRAVPADAVVAVASWALNGEVVQRLVLALPLLAAFGGVVRLLAELPVVARVAGGLCFVWSPYVFERLAIGHWGLLVGYAALPWVVWAVLRLRDVEPRNVGRRRAGAVLVAGLFAAGWSSPTGALLAVGAALVFAWGCRRSLALVAGAGIVVNLPWLLPALLNGAGQIAPDGFGVEAFASRSDSPWGVWGSLFTFGGIWKFSIVPEVREQWLFAVVAMAVSVVALAGLWWGHRGGRDARVLPRTPALVLAGTGLALAGAGSWDVTRPLLEWCVVHVPGGGLLRDGQKWVAWWSLPAAVGFGSAVARLVRLVLARGGGRAGARVTGLCAALLPVLALPTLAAGLGGMLSAVEYPDDWAAVRDVMEREGNAGDRVVALPFSTYRQFDWNPRPVLDPVSRYLPGDTVTEDALTVDAGTVGGEDPLAARIRTATTAEALRDVLVDGGVRWVVVHLSSTEAPLPAGARTVWESEQLDLLELPAASPGEGPGEGRGSSWRAPLFAGVDLAVLLLSSIVVIRGLTSRNPSQAPE